MNWLPRKVNAQGAALLASGLLIVALFAIPFTSKGARESLSVPFGGWRLWHPGYTDGGDWIPVEPEFEPSGPDESLLRAYLAEDGKSDGAYVDEHPNDLRLRALHIYNVLRNNSVNLIEFVDSPTRGEVNPKDVERLKAAQPIFRRIARVAAVGEQQEPNNAFFPVAQVAAYEGLRDSAAAASAAERATKCAYYNDYSYQNTATFLKAMYGDQPSHYDDMYYAIVGGSEYLWEVRKLALRWGHRDDVHGMRLRKLFIDWCPLLSNSAETLSDVGTIRSAVKGCAIPLKDWYREYDMERRSNDGDLYRNITNFQNNLIALGMTPKFDIPAFFAIEPGAELEDYGIDDGNNFDWTHQGWGALLTYSDYVIIGTGTFYGLASLLLAVPLLWLLTAVLRFQLPKLGIAPMAAATFAALLVIEGGEHREELIVLAAIFSLSFFVICWKLDRASLVLGACACVFAVVITFTGNNYYSTGMELIPAAVYAVGTARYYWLRDKQASRGWILSTVAVAFVAWCTEIRYSEFDWIQAAGVACVLVLAVASVSAWHCLQPSDACRRVLRSIPFAMLTGVGLLFYCSLKQHLLVSDMDRLIAIEAEMTSRWREEVSKVGPPQTLP